MKVAAIIAEYNPFHNGHKHQIDTIKELGYDYVISIMSSSFVQRGEPAIFDKWTRTKAALLNGVDLILELPLPYSISTAQVFAQGAIHILTQLPFVTDLFFGAENPMEELIGIQQKMKYIDEAMIKQSLKEGYSFLRAREKALTSLLTPEEIQILQRPNNILALEYLNALLDPHNNITPITPHALPRKHVNHNDSVPFSHYASAGTIRNMIRCKENYFPFVPQNTHLLYQSRKKVWIEDFYPLFCYEIMSAPHLLSNSLEYEEGLERRLMRALSAKDYFEFMKKISTKRYTTARLKRLLFSHLFHLDKEKIRESLAPQHPAYLRLLGCDIGAKALLGQLPKTTILRFGRDMKKIEEKTAWILTKEIFATNLYFHFVEKEMNLDFTNSFLLFDREKNVFLKNQRQ